MINLGTPPDLENYILVQDNELIYELHILGYYPVYRDSKGVYFLYSVKLLEDISKM